MSTSIDPRIGRRVRHLREQQECGLTALARRIRISKQYLSDMEVGRRGISPDMVQRIAAALGVGVEAITHERAVCGMRSCARFVCHLP